MDPRPVVKRSHCTDKGMQMFLASWSQTRCHYRGLVSDLLFSAHLLNWARAYLVVTARQRHLCMLEISSLPGRAAFTKSSLRLCSHRAKLLEGRD
ncbi:hypothetical protein JOQ06_006683, partial [Pogonophryne albipinna]